ncbi:hypothetical protein EW146_g6452 [Bondarzewia mesenterica]|uniref:Uncharacterized protein n=1 Tax=Bondarzewia mesenterica TaxID=1095465 RepID=A0A4S4LNF6_9AGAM|nr:hypothetical protein EW146_g6452 [Bondarzewia mesenterica]
MRISNWTSPPTRRECTLLLFCLSIFVLAYNFDASLRLLSSTSPSLPSSSSLFGIALRSSSAPPIGPDGRKPEGYRDALEGEIFGEWDWDEGRVAGVKASEETRIIEGSGKNKGQDRYVRGEGVPGRNAMWLQGVGEGAYGVGEGLGSSNVNDGFVRWGEDLPASSLVAHVPGFTILDRVFLSNGTLFIVSEEPSSLPALDSMGSSMSNSREPPRDVDWQILSHKEAVSTLGEYGGKIHGVTYMSYDISTATDAHTLLSMQRVYSTIPSHKDTPPHRLFFPAIPTFSDRRPEPEDDTVVRRRSNSGTHPFTIKAAYPSLAGALFAEDFDDFKGLDIPMLLDRVVIADRGAATRHGVAADSWAGPFTALRAPQTWFDGVRNNLARYFGEGEEKSRGKKEVTYLVQQSYVGSGARLRTEDHEALLKELKGLQRSGYQINVVDESAAWSDRMKSIVQSTVVIGVFGDHLSDSVFMKSSPQTTLMEFFPSGSFTRDWEIVMHSMGTRYIAWQGDQKFTSQSLPLISRPSGAQEVRIDAKAVVRAIKEELSRKA